MGWGGRWEGGSEWGTQVNPWLIHINVWQKPLQYCKEISLQLIKIEIQKKKSNIWRLNNTLLNNQQITEEIKICIETNENENTTTQNLIRKLWYTYTMEYYSDIKRYAFESVLMRQMKLEPIIHSEVSQKEKHQYSIIIHIYGI